MIKQAYPDSAKNLHRFTMTVDVDVYDSEGEKVLIDIMPHGSDIKISTSRLEDKDKQFQSMNISDPTAIQGL